MRQSHPVGWLRFARVVQRQIATSQQGLDQKKPQRDDPGETGSDIDRVAPCQQRAGCCHCDGEARRNHQADPDQKLPHHLRQLGRLQDEVRL